MTAKTKKNGNKTKILETVNSTNNGYKIILPIYFKNLEIETKYFYYSFGWNFLTCKRHLVLMTSFYKICKNHFILNYFLSFKIYVSPKIIVQFLNISKF